MKYRKWKMTASGPSSQIARISSQLNEVDMLNSDEERELSVSISSFRI
jgi:hypothetical protein